MLNIYDRLLTPRVSGSSSVFPNHIESLYGRLYVNESANSLLLVSERMSSFLGLNTGVPQRFTSILPLSSSIARRQLLTDKPVWYVLYRGRAKYRPTGEISNQHIYLKLMAILVSVLLFPSRLAYRPVYSRNFQNCMASTVPSLASGLLPTRG